MRNAARRLLLAPALGALDPLLPLHRLWWALFGVPMAAVLHWLVGALSAYPVTLAIGPYGLAVIAMTVLVRFVLLPLAAYQARASLRARRDALELHARLGPRVDRLRRRHRGRPLELRRAVDELLREHRADPLGALGSSLRSSLLPLLLQTPVLIAFYWVILGLARSAADLHFLWIASLAAPDALVLPVLAGLSAALLARLAARAQVPPLVEDEQAAAARRLSFLVSPAVLAVTAHFAPAALVLYWLTGNLFAAAWQWVVNRFLLGPPAPGPKPASA
jgi:YidC/Oxa1 family membrane protein insertase